MRETEIRRARNGLTRTPARAKPPAVDARPPRVDAWCDFTDLAAAGCAHCLGHHDDTETAAAATRAVADAPWFTSQYPGRCAGCGEPFEPGARIRKAAPSGWLADCCADTQN